MVDIRTHIAIFLSERNILIALGPGGCQLAAWVHSAGEYVCQCVAALLAQLTGKDHRLDGREILHKGQIKGCTGIHDQNDVLVVFAACHQVRPFRIGQGKVLLAAVLALTGLAGEYIDADIRIIGQVGSTDGITVGIAIFRCHHFSQHFRADLVQLLAHSGNEYFPLLCPQHIVAVQPISGNDLKAAAFQTLPDGDGMALNDLTAAGATFDGFACTGTVKGDFTGLKGQNALILQQDDCFGGCLIGKRPVGKLQCGYFVCIFCFRSEFHR